MKFKKALLFMIIAMTIAGNNVIFSNAVNTPSSTISAETKDQSSGIQEEPNTQTPQTTSPQQEASITITQQNKDLKFDTTKYEEKTMTVAGKQVSFRAYEGIVYVKNPVDVNYQYMNIYIPVEYFNNKSVNGYNANTAPIFFPNSVGGYMPSTAATPSESSSMGNPTAQQTQPQNNTTPSTNAPQLPQAEVGDNEANAVLTALSRGYIVAAPATRGRTLQDEKGNYYGKAPAVIVDLKAAVRYLKFNDKLIPGNSNKIISNGTSAGGAVSALLGASGNAKDYEPYLKEIGAADATDDIFAVMAYCPITDLDHADMAYEWLLNGINDYESMNITKENGKIQRTTENKSLTDEQIQLSNQLAEAFPAYLNSLRLTNNSGIYFSLDSNGEGNFKDYIKSYVIASAQKALDEGEDLSKFSYVKIQENKVVDLDFDKYLELQLKRMKSAPSFDSNDLLSGGTGENNLFGTKTVDAMHFTEFSQNADYYQRQIANKDIVKMMNPLNYIGENNATTAKNWRIRYGTADSNTSLAVPTILATKLENKGYKVDFSMPWNVGHRGDYDLNELFTWVDSISK